MRCSTFTPPPHRPALPDAECLRHVRGGCLSHRDGRLRARLDTVAEYLNGKGKVHVRAWNDALYTPGTTVALNSNVDVAYWTRWHGSFPTVKTIKDNGHRLINFNDAYFYYVLARPGGAYSTKPSPQKIWNEWKPGVFPRAAGAAQNLPTDDPSLAGASFAIWSDFAEMETQAQVAAGIKQPLRAMAGRSWKAESTAPWEVFNANSQRIGDAPAPSPLVEPVLDLTLTADPTGTVDAGTTQDWSLRVENDGETSPNASVSTDLSQLLAVATHGTATTTVVDANGSAVAASGKNVALNRPVTSSGQEVAGQWVRTKLSTATPAPVTRPTPRTPPGLPSSWRSRLSCTT